MSWFHRDLFAWHVNVCFADSNLENMNAFLAMSRHSELQRIVEELADYEGGRYFAIPGEYLELTMTMMAEGN